MKALLFALLPLTALLAAEPGGALSVSQYPSIQEAIDKNPGRVICVPAGDYEISQPLVITKDDTGLAGPGRIVCTNVDVPIIQISKAANVRLIDVTFSRPAGRTDTMEPGIEAQDSPGLSLDSVRVIDNRTRLTAILLSRCDNSRIVNCLVQDYMRIVEEDRRQKKGQGYAFMTLGGTGIDIRECHGVLIQGTRIIELAFTPTQELKDKYGLGKITAKNAVKGEYVSQAFWDSGYNNAWHQGSALHVGGSNYVQILGNYIEDAAQGIDIQSDHVIMANNIVNKAFAGMKAIHGSRNLALIGNQFSHCDLWATSIAPGTASHAAGAPGPDGKPAEANVDGGTVVAHNIISDFGYGPANWMWDGAERYAMRFDEPQLAGTPPEHDVVVEGNIVYDPGRDGVLVDGQPQILPPRYLYALYVSTLPGAPQNIRFANNIFAPGSKGVSNIPLKENQPSLP